MPLTHLKVLDIDASAPRPEVLNRLAWTNRWRDRVRSTDCARQVVALDLEDDIEMGRALMTLAWQEKWRGNLDAAGRLADQALARLDGTPAQATAAAAHSVAAVVHYSRGRYDLARAAIAAGHTAIGIQNDPETQADLLVAEAAVLRYLGHRDEAFARLWQASAVAEDATLARVIHNISRSHLHEGETDEAITTALRAVTLSKRHENRVVYPYALEVLGAAHRLSGRIDRARACLRSGIRIARADGDRRVECQLLGEAGELALETYEASEAISLLREGKSIAEELSYDIWKARFFRDLARAYEMSGDTMSALASMKSLDRLTRQVRA